MKKIAGVLSCVAIFSGLALSPAIAQGAPTCFIITPKMCETYDYIYEQINSEGALCKTRYYSNGSSQSSEGLGCTGGTPKVEAKPVETKSTEVVVPQVPGNNYTNQPTTDTKNNLPTEIVSIPSSTTSPTIVGNKNSVSSSNASTNQTSNSVVNTTNNSFTTNNISTVSNVRSDYKTIAVNGGVLLIGENGFAKFFPIKEEPETNNVTNSEKTETGIYLEKEDLPKQMVKSINRLPESISSKKSLRLPFALRKAESVTEDVCLVEGNRLNPVTKGICVIEIPVGEGIYEHEIQITK
jgi:hypothetical protein